VSTTAAVEPGTFELTIMAAGERGSENAITTLIQPWRLVWNDEFDAADGSAPDASKWNIEKGGHGWGTGEIECYKIFNHPADLLVNFAVGGNWPREPDSTTVFPQTMLVDYVRVFARAQ
jgi:hypothetical protein